MEMSQDELWSAADDKIALAKRLVQTIDKFRQIDGAQKIQRKINQELKFLEKVQKSGQLKVNHVLCSNLVHYECLIGTLLQCQNIKHVDYPVPMEERQSPLRIDIVCDNGATWIKVIARNPKSLSDSAYGRSGYGSKTILDQAAEFVQAASDNVYFFKPPKVIFTFCHKIDNDLSAELLEIGVTIDQQLAKNKSTSEYASGVDIVERLALETNDQEAISRVDTLNLDVTTMLAYISAMTNGSNNWEYQEPILTEQALWERQNPVKAELDRVFTGKSLICCETAANSFWEITNLLGGTQERIRAKAFMERVKVRPDVDQPPPDLERLTFGGKIKTRSLKIFSFGIVHQAMTVTANEGFIRSAKMQGVHIPAFVHGARPLSEQKEAKATSIQL